MRRVAAAAGAALLLSPAVPAAAFVVEVTTSVVVTHAVVRGNTLYVRMLLADQAGEQTFQDLRPGGEAPAASVTAEIQI